MLPEDMSHHTLVVLVVSQTALIVFLIIALVFFVTRLGVKRAQFQRDLKEREEYYDGLFRKSERFYKLDSRIAKWQLKQAVDTLYAVAAFRDRMAHAVDSAKITKVRSDVVVDGINTALYTRAGEPFPADEEDLAHDLTRDIPLLYDDYPNQNNRTDETDGKEE